MTKIAQIELGPTDDGPRSPPEAASPGAPAAAAALPSRPRSALAVAGVALAGVAVTVSLVAALFAARAVREARATVASIERQHAALAELPALILRLEAAARNAERKAARQPVDEASMRSQLAQMRQDMARYVDGRSQAPVLRQGQTEIANRLGLVIERLNRIEARLDAR